MSLNILKTILRVLALFSLFAGSAYAQGFLYQNVLLRGGGGGNGAVPVANATVAVCNPAGLATTAASVSGNVATLTMSSNPQTAGFGIGATITVSGFTGSDTYFNGNFVLTGVSSTTLTFNLTHANASASSNGAVVQTVSQGATWSCAPLASIFTTAQLNAPENNPFNTDNYGNYAFAAAPGTYNVSFTGAATIATEQSVTLPCVPNSTCPLSGVSLALPVTITGSGYSNSLAGTVSAARTWYLQDVSDYFVFRTTTDTLTNKTLTSPTITSPTTTGTDSGTETLTNKTLSSPTITSPSTTGTDSGTETLQNKTIAASSNTIDAPGSNQQILYNNNGPLGATTGIVTDGTNIAFNDSATITSSPPSLAGSNTGWKFCLYSTTYCEGIATDTKVNLVPYWFSIFSGNPSNNATSTTPDGSAKLTLGANSTIIAPEISTPADPPSGSDTLYLNSSTHTLSCLTSSGGNCLAAGGVADATWSPYAISVNAAGIYAEMSLPNAHTLEGFYIYVVTAASGCSTFPTVSFYDETGSSALASITFTTGQFFSDGSLSVSMTAGHNFSIRVTTAGSGCSTPPEDVQFSVIFK